MYIGDIRLRTLITNEYGLAECELICLAQRSDQDVDSSDGCDVRFNRSLPDEMAKQPDQRVNFGVWDYCLKASEE